MIEKMKWEEFRNSGMLWLINRTLHLFGMAIVMRFDDNTDELLEVYPARCKFRGFTKEVETEGFRNVYKYLDKNLLEIKKEADE